MILRELTDEEYERVRSLKWWHRIPVGMKDEKIVYTPGEVFHGPDGDDWATTRFGLPADLSGKTVVDVGAWDGYFSFEAEWRGAKAVLACDEPGLRRYGSTEGFECAAGLLRSGVHYAQFDLDSEDAVSKNSVGDFDVVLCYGVLYHILNPITCLKNLYRLTKPGGLCLIETARDPDETLANYRTWSLLPGREGDPTNYWYPSVSGLEQALSLVGFEDFEVVFDMTSRVTVKVTRPAEDENEQNRNTGSAVGETAPGEEGVLSGADGQRQTGGSPAPS